MSRNVRFTPIPSVDLIGFLLYRKRKMHGAYHSVSLFSHKRISVVGGRNEILLDRSRRNPSEQVHHGTGLVVRAARTRSSKGLLTDNSPCRFIVHIKISSGKTQSAICIGDSFPVGGEHTSGQTIRRSLVDNREDF